MPPEDQNKISLQTAEQYKLLYTISNNIEVYEEPVPRTKKIHYCAVKFETDEEERPVTNVCTDALMWASLSEQ